MTDYGDIQIDFKLVNHKKQPGTLKLSMQYVLWEPDLLGENVAIPIETIKAHKISPDGKSKVQIQLIIKDGTAVTFHFTNNNPVGQAKEQRDKVKVHLARLIGRVVSKKPTKEFEERKKILQKNPSLLKLYKELVLPGKILPEEFWSSRASLLDLSGQQDIGVTGNFLSDLTPKSDGSNSIRYNLTDEMKQIIFRTYPAVKAKCLELCPSQISEKEFWTEFFQSQYFHRDKSLNSKDQGIFEECDRMEEANVRTQPTAEFLRLHEIFEEDEQQDDQTDLALEKQKIKDKKQRQTLSQKEVNRLLIRRFNQHSSLVLKASERLKRSAEHVVIPIPVKQTKDEISLLKLENEDLANNVQNSATTLSLSNKNLFLNSAKNEEDTSLLAKLKDRQRRSCLEKFTRATNDYQPRINETISHAQADFPAVLIELMQEQRKERNERQQVTQLNVVEAMTECKEILTHFWSCFPPKPDIMEKLTRMHQNILIFDENQLKVLEEEYSGENDCTLHEMREMVDFALAKFNAFEMKRKRIL